MRYLLQHRVRGTEPWVSRWSLRCSVESAKDEIDYTRYPNIEYRVMELRDDGNIFFEVWRTPKDEWIKGYFRVFSNGDLTALTGWTRAEAEEISRPDRIGKVQSYEVNTTTGQVRLVPECQSDQCHAFCNRQQCEPGKCPFKRC